jgi:hypothetical protein
MRWNWRRWQALAKARVTDADALQLALVWPGYARTQPGRRRGFWAHEMTYEALSGWTMSRVMRAANVLEAAGLASRCPGTPLYVPLDPEQSPGGQPPGLVPGDQPQTGT